MPAISGLVQGGGCTSNRVTLDLQFCGPFELVCGATQAKAWTITPLTLGSCATVLFMNTARVNMLNNLAGAASQSVMPFVSAGILRVLRQLDQQARLQGGAVYMLNGNHESLNVCGDFR